MVQQRKRNPNGAGTITKRKDGRFQCAVYVLQPDGSAAATADKALYVSPFFDVSGQYSLRFTLTPQQVSCVVTLRRDDELAFAASFHGRPHPATRRGVVRMQLRQPLMPQRVTGLIRMHGVWLWLRGLPVVPR